MRRSGIGLALLAAALALSGCRTLRFYGQAIKGQYELITSQRPIQRLLAEPATPPRLAERLRLVNRLRDFAESQLKLPVNGHYRKYADLGREFVVWNVEAAPEFSLAPKTWWYPIVGSLEYRGYFSLKAGIAYANSLEKRGYDTYLGGATAYSTLGWFKDPVLNTFIFDPEPFLAETLFHELGHQQVFARGDTDFNEAFATTVGEEGARRWLRASGGKGLDEYEGALKRTDEFVDIVTDARARLADLYGDVRDEDGKLKSTDAKRSVPRGELQRQKREIIEQMRRNYAGLKKEWGDHNDYDDWFANGINNAKLNSVAAYYDLVPGFEKLLKMNGGDLPKFYNAAERLAKMPKAERHQELRGLAK